VGTDGRVPTLGVHELEPRHVVGNQSRAAPLARLQHDGPDWPLRQALTLKHGEDLSLSPVEDERH